MKKITEKYPNLEENINKFFKFVLYIFGIFITYRLVTLIFDSRSEQAIVFFVLIVIAVIWFGRNTQ